MDRREFLQTAGMVAGVVVTVAGTQFIAGCPGGGGGFDWGSLPYQDQTKVPSVPRPFGRWRDGVVCRPFVHLDRVLSYPDQPLPPGHLAAIAPLVPVLMADLHRYYAELGLPFEWAAREEAANVHVWLYYNDLDRDAKSVSALPADLNYAAAVASIHQWDDLTDEPLKATSATVPPKLPAENDPWLGVVHAQSGEFVTATCLMNTWPYQYYRGLSERYPALKLDPAAMFVDVNGNGGTWRHEAAHWRVGLSDDPRSGQASGLMVYKARQGFMSPAERAVSRSLYRLPVEAV